VRRPNIPENIRQALEKCGPETVRTILFQGWANAEDLPEEVKEIAGQQSQVRKAAIKWLNWKDANQAWRDNILIGPLSLRQLPLRSGCFLIGPSDRPQSDGLAGRKRRRPQALAVNGRRGRRAPDGRRC